VDLFVDQIRVAAAVMEEHQPVRTYQHADQRVQRHGGAGVGRVALLHGPTDDRGRKRQQRGREQHPQAGSVQSPVRETHALVGRRVIELDHPEVEKQRQAGQVSRSLEHQPGWQPAGLDLGCVQAQHQ